jgi:hypothetical protein
MSLFESGDTVPLELEKRTHAGPAGTKVPSAVGKNRTSDVEVPVGWREYDFK